MEQKEIVGTSGIVLVEVFATWCPHCKNMIPLVDDFKKRSNCKTVIIDVDKQKSNKFMKEFNIMSVPTFMFFKDGKLVKRIIGRTTTERLATEYEKLSTSNKSI